MRRIIILEPNVANKIAAGEVVERPASIVKELVENSVDAGSTAVTVEIRNGGIDYIRVTDNGSGIEEADVPVAFLRHATGKISNAEELNSIETFGFRGEALASVAAVSKVSMRTRTQDADRGTHIEIEGGKQTALTECGCPCGTTVEINELFYNVPARLKFLKSARSEAALIGDFLLRLILSNTDTSIKFINNGKTVYHSYGDGKLENALFCVYDSFLISKLYKVLYDDGYVKITGFSGSENTARSSRTYQSVFVNKRYIKSNIISYAAQRAYDTRLMGGKFPFFVLNITVSPFEVDVNVHPNKLSVRFKDEQRISSAVTNAVRNALEGKIMEETVSGKKEAASEDKQKAVPAAAGRGEASYTETNPKDARETLYEVFSRDACSAVEKRAKIKAEHEQICDPLSMVASEFDRICKNDTEWKLNDSEGNVPVHSGNPDVRPLYIDGDGTETVETDIESGVSELITKFKLKIDTNGSKNDVTPKEGLDKKSGGVGDIPVIKLNVPKKDEHKILRPEQINIGEIPHTVVGVAFDTYIIIQQGEAIYFIDQHAAHERILYEKFISNEMRFDSQLLLIPEILKLDAVSLATVKDNKEKFSEIGFSMEFPDETSLKISAVPSIIECDAAGFILEAVDFISQKGDVDEKDLVRSRLIQLSCKRAVKAGDKLEAEEIESILKAYSRGKTPLNCPHGRPVIIKLSKTELEKMFKRIV